MQVQIRKERHEQKKRKERKEGDGEVGEYVSGRICVKSEILVRT